MPRWTEPSAVRSTLRAAGIVVAVISASIAVFLVVFSEASRSAQFGMLLGFWAALILAFSLVRGHDAAVQELPAVPVATELAEVTRPAPTMEELTAGMVLELRRNAELEREKAEVERRRFQLELELMLRREVEHVMSAQMESLRQEIAGLRAEIMDNVGGALRLERIETTRLIGSDVQALQQEIRRLASVREAMELSMEAEDSRIIDAQIVPESEVLAEQEPEPEVLAEPEPQPEPDPEPAPDPEPVQDDAGASATPRRPSFDFADLPSVSRLTPLPPVTEGPRYSGRRRAAGDDEPDIEVPVRRSGGQRRARDDSDDVLARLLGR